MRVSFCTTCMGRLHHLKETLFKNLEDNQDHQDLEIVILDYNSQDGLEDWARKNLSSLVESGIIAYWKDSTALRWKMPHAKNVAHLLATGDIVCNLDADNLTGTGYAATLNDIFTSAPRSMITHMHGGGFGGRVALMKTDFLKLRGYDEELSYGWGMEDDDLKLRAAAAGLVKIELQMTGDNAIPHEDLERLRFMPEWENLQKAHSEQSIVFERRPAGGIINPNGLGKSLVKNLKGETKSCGVFDLVS